AAAKKSRKFLPHVNFSSSDLPTFPMRGAIPQDSDWVREWGKSEKSSWSEAMPSSTSYAVGQHSGAARIRKRGFTKLQTDDWLVFNLIFWYTLLVVSLNKIFFSGGSNFMTEEEEAALTPEITAQRVVGSKWVLVSEEAMVLTVWTCKLCMLFLYRHITSGLKQAKMINIAFVWLALGFVGTQFGLFLSCRPFSEYWAVPTENTQCWSYFNYQIVEAVFNISSDIFVLAIAIPILLKLQVPLLQRAILVAIFGMGVFIIIAAILTKLFSLYPPLLTYAYLNWYCREASVCVYVTNLPAVWTLILDLFPGLRSLGRGTKNTSGSNDGAGRAGRGQDYKLQNFSRLVSTTGAPGQKKSESQEYIVPETKSLHGGLQINKDVTFTVRRNSLSDEDNLAPVKPGENAAVAGGGSYSTHCNAV
ncbi:MAG: hypothetical protein Q9177_006470, partial [Variospora cf. flavescens]